MSATPAGWYDDGHGAMRWWDGAQWTEHVQTDAAPPAPAAPQAPEPAVNAGYVVPPQAPASGSPVYPQVPQVPQYGQYPGAFATAPNQPPRTKSNIWIIWVVVGVLALGAVISAAVLIPMMLFAVGDSGSSDSPDEKAAVEAVTTYDEAWNEGDCDKYMASTTESFRAFEQMEDCAAFEEASDYFTSVNDDYQTDVTGVESQGSTIVVETTETYMTSVDADGVPLSEPVPGEDHYSYVLVAVDGGWAIDDADVE